MFVGFVHFSTSKSRYTTQEKRDSQARKARLFFFFESSHLSNYFSPNTTTAHLNDLLPAKYSSIRVLLVVITLSFKCFFLDYQMWQFPISLMLFAESNNLRALSSLSLTSFTDILKILAT